MNEILSAFRDQGLDPGRVECDGKVHRFKIDNRDTKESGWYIAYQNHARDGEVFHVAVFGNYKLGDTFKYQTDKKYSADDRKFIKEQLARAKKAQEATQEKVWKDTAEEIEKQWAGFLLFGESSYIRKKQIADCKYLGVRYDLEGTIYVPMADENGKLWSLQKIKPDGTKRFSYGGRVAGCFHTIGDIDSADTIYIGEGLATGASISLAVSAPCVVCFSAANLPRVAATLRSKYPNKSFVICGDDDRFTQKPDGSPSNPGQERSEEAAKVCLGIAVFPKFESLENKPTDFNDLHVREGLDKVKEQILRAQNEKQEKMFVYALGFSEKEYFFTSSHNQQIVGVTKFSQTDFLNLMPLSYWEAMFPGAGAVRVDWAEATSRMMSECRAKGIFQMHNVRGSGVWRDEGRIVINMGDHLIVDGERMDLGKIKSRYFYALAANLSRFHASPLSSDECEAFIGACETFKWIKPDFGILLAGALVCARVCGALPIRPHVWVTGGAGEGKSTLLEKLIKPVLGSNLIYVRGSTTEAGIRQLLKANAFPVLFDEFETTGQKSFEKVQEVMDLLRAAWSDSDAQVVKGSAGGTATAFRLNCSAIVSSIRTKLMNDADVGRFARIELAPHGSDQDHWEKLSTYLDRLTPDYCDRLFSRTIHLMPVMLANYRKLKSALSKRVSSRFGDQYGMILAGYSILYQDDVINDAQVEVMIERIKLTDEKADAKVADHEDCLTHLLTRKIMIDRAGNRLEYPIGQAINDCFVQNDRYCKEALQLIGVRVDTDTVSVSTKHSELEKQIYGGTRWSNSWANSLSRLPGAERGKQIKIGGSNNRPVVLPKKLF